MADERNRMLEQLNTDDWQECRQSVLIVDDSAMNRRMLTEILGGRFDTAEATSGEECLHLLEENRDGISIVLLDIHMEGMDGFAVLEEMDRQKMLEDIPVIMISSEDKVDAMRRAFDLGASDYISRPFDARVVCQRIGNTMRLYAKQRRLCAAVEKQIREADQNSRIMLALLNRVMEKRNGESRNHVRRIQIITALLLAQLAQKNGQHWLTGSVRRRITLAAALHDIGKIELENRLLCNTAPTAEEETLLRQHTTLGAQMLEENSTRQEAAFVQTAAQICRWHHERYDGSGYPDGLVGEQIPLEAQVVGLADAYDALAGGENGRPYPHQPIRIAGAIISFVVPAADLCRRLHKSRFLPGTVFFQHLCTGKINIIIRCAGMLQGVCCCDEKVLLFLKNQIKFAKR